ncbi:KTSC domain-containing protein [Caminicella sporogenes]|uniref:KTSC domain-containing protein n=1 Tax=Caminicella sporogenes TaxID=166485 RepID=UPI002541070E|nr:KTSC domain-containing protein [Caminicella sporogenes]WIF96213.1 KTSC domain-containing protein [Caminicella sporogenes]
MIPVSSSNLVAVGYDRNSRTLVIRFHNGTYAYSGVPEEIYKGLLNASSKGHYHHVYIKNSYPYRRIG